MGGLDQQCRTMRIENIKKNIHILYRATQSMIKLVKKGNGQRPNLKNLSHHLNLRRGSNMVDST